MEGSKTTCSTHTFAFSGLGTGASPLSRVHTHTGVSGTHVSPHFAWFSLVSHTPAHTSVPLVCDLHLSGSQLFIIHTLFAPLGVTHILRTHFIGGHSGTRFTVHEPLSSPFVFLSSLYCSIFSLHTFVPLHTLSLHLSPLGHGGGSLFLPAPACHILRLTSLESLCTHYIHLSRALERHTCNLNPLTPAHHPWCPWAGWAWDTSQGLTWRHRPHRRGCSWSCCGVVPRWAGPLSGDLSLPLYYTTYGMFAYTTQTHALSWLHHHTHTHLLSRHLTQRLQMDHSTHALGRSAHWTHVRCHHTTPLFPSLLHFYHLIGIFILPRAARNTEPTLYASHHSTTRHGSQDLVLLRGQVVHTASH